MKTQSEIAAEEMFLEAIEQALPAVFARKNLGILTGGLIHPNTIANLMSLKIGPPGIRLGRRVGFARSSFIEWLRKSQLNNLK